MTLPQPAQAGRMATAFIAGMAGGPAIGEPSGDD